MDPDETIIFQYLTSWPGEFVASQQICRQADGRRRFEAEPKWAFLVLARMVDQGILESDGGGRYRVPADPKAKPKPSRWISPHMQQILNRSGKFDQPNAP